MARRLCYAALLLLMASCWVAPLTAADRAVYTDALTGPFQDYSYANAGVVDFADTTAPHSGSFNIRFVGDNYGAVVPFFTEGLLANSQYSTLRFWIHGGPSGGQALRVWVIDTILTNTFANAPLSDFIPGGLIPADRWVQVDVPLASGPLAALPYFNRIEIQSDVVATQPAVLLDDISLLDAGGIFASGFEHGEGVELLFVPQYSRSSISVYRRGGGGFVFLRETPLGAGVTPNALVFAQDGKLWVVDNARRLLRYKREAILYAAAPSPEATITGPALSQGDIFNLAFFGDSAYVTQSNFAATNRVIRYNVADLASTGSPLPSATYASSGVPAGLAFDAFGRLFVSAYGSNQVRRHDPPSGTVGWESSNVAVGARNALNRPEGLAFDAEDSLFVGNNGEPTISAYASWQYGGLSGSYTPIHQIDINPVLFQGDTVGGLAFAADGGLWANYQKTLEVLEYTLVAFPLGGGNPGDIGSYTSTAGQAIANGSSFPGFGGIAIWPVPDTLHR